jgi:hypothetical protein
MIWDGLTYFEITFPGFALIRFSAKLLATPSISYKSYASFSSSEDLTFEN